MEIAQKKAAPAPSTGTLQRGSGRWSIVWAVGMLAIFVGERMIGSGSSRTVATVARSGAGDRRDRRALRARGQRGVRPPQLENTLLALYAVGLGAVAALRDPVGPVGVRVQAAARAQLAEAVDRAVGAVAGGLCSPRPGRSCWSSWRTRRWRARRGWSWGGSAARMLSGFGLAAALMAAFSFSYVASERDKKLDLAYFRTSRPGEVTRRIVRNLDQPIEIAVFFPSANEVRDEVDDYLDDLAKESSQLKITHYDFDIDPVKAKEYGVSDQRHPGVRARQQARAAGPAAATSKARRPPCKTLDKEVQQRLLTVVKPPRTAGFTLGHGERTWERGETDTDKRAGIAVLRDALIDQTYDVRVGQPGRRPHERGPQGRSPCWRSSGRARRSSPRSRLDQPLHRRRRARADRARSREQGRHARGARAAQPRRSRRSRWRTNRPSPAGWSRRSATAPTW